MYYAEAGDEGDVEDSAMTTNFSNTFRNPSRPTWAFCWNRLIEKSSIVLSHRDKKLPTDNVACCVNCVLL